MTRLIEDWIQDLGTAVKRYERDLMAKAGFDYLELASVASGVARDNLILSSKSNKIGVIPVTAGLGIIGSFSESVAAIIRCMNFDAFVTENTDIAGIYEAHQKGATSIFIADDSQFIAINLQKNLVSENSRATARGYVAALEGAARGLRDKDVLTIGCGVVGQEILESLKLKGAHPVAYDINKVLLQSLAKHDIAIASGLADLVNYELVMDASSEGGWIHQGMLHPRAWIATPGIPLSLDSEAYDHHKDRVIHDYLQIGVATMLAEVC